MNQTKVAISSVLIMLLSVGFVAAQRGGDDAQKPDSTNGVPPGPLPTATPPPADDKPDVLPAKAFADSVQTALTAWQPSKARAQLEAQKQKFQGSPYFDATWAFLLAEERQFDQALTALNAADKADPKDPMAPYLLGEVQSWKGDANAAKSAWGQAKSRATAIVATDPGDARAQYWLGASLVRLGEFDAARSHLDKALAKGFQTAMTEYQIGLALSYQRNWSAARDAFNRVLGIDSGFAMAYYYRGRVWKELGKTEEMLLDMDRFLKLAPDAREANAARSLLNAGG